MAESRPFLKAATARKRHSKHLLYKAFVCPHHRIKNKEIQPKAPMDATRPIDEAVDDDAEGVACGSSAAYCTNM